MTNILVTGGNRGIGLEICKQMVARGANVYATSRGPSEALADTGVTLIPAIDVADSAAIEQLAIAMDGVKLDILLNNAGVLTRESLNDMNFERILHQFQVNAMGPLRVTHALLANLSKDSKVAIVTSRVGSIEDNSSGNNYGYRMSKSAANMAGKNLALDLGKLGIPVVMLHPGLVATEMTGGTGVDPALAAEGIIRQIDQLTMETTGTFWHAEGYQLPW